MYRKSLKNREKIFSVAPMMDWTDRHCRYFHRHLSKHALLYTEMVVADALVHGDVARHLDFDAIEHPVAVQLGGSEPDKLQLAAKLCEDWGYDEINLNVGCPSDRVQSGAFGACLMREPDLVARCVEAMKAVVRIPVTVKCRIGVDDQDAEAALDDVARMTFDAGSDALWVHARKAWLQGLSPRENRDVPPLDYQRVMRLKKKFASHFIGINGGIDNLNQALVFLDGQGLDEQGLDEQGLDEQGLDGVMLGRAAYQKPALLCDVDYRIYGAPDTGFDPVYIRDVMMDHTARHIAVGGRANHVTRHMIGLFQGQPGARRFRQILSVEACRPDATEQVIADAFAAVTGDRDAA